MVLGSTLQQGPKSEDPMKEIRLPLLGSPTPTHVVIAEIVRAVNELIRRENERYGD